MSIISKLKGAKKAADEHKAKEAKASASTSDKPAPAPYRHIPTHAATDSMTGLPNGWKADDREQNRIQTEARLSRLGSDYFSRPSTAHTTSPRPTRPDFNRACSDSSLDLPPREARDSVHSIPGNTSSSGSSIKSQSRSQSFTSLEMVVEDRNVDDAEPVFAATILANRNRPSRHSRSHRISMGKSPLSSVEYSTESSPVESENSSEASDSSSGAIELRSEPVNFPQVHDIHPGEKVTNDIFAPQIEHRYFAHRVGSQPTLATEVPETEPVIKKERFSFMKRHSASSAVSVR